MREERTGLELRRFPTADRVVFFPGDEKRCGGCAVFGKREPAGRPAEP